MAQAQQTPACTHGLNSLLADVFWSCDECGCEVDEGLEVFSCSICEREICKACHTAHETKLTTPKQSEIGISAERRIDPDDGLEYTFQEFCQRYGTANSTEEMEQYWLDACRPTHQDAARAVQCSSDEPAATQTGTYDDRLHSSKSYEVVQRRIDPDDGLEYTFEEFCQRYAGAWSNEDLQEYWITECQPVPARSVDDSMGPSHESDAFAEPRLDPDDGVVYTFSEFYNRSVASFSEQEIREYWVNECQPTRQAAAAADRYDDETEEREEEQEEYEEEEEEEDERDEEEHEEEDHEEEAEAEEPEEAEEEVLEDAEEEEEEDADDQEEEEEEEDERLLLAGHDYLSRERRIDPGEDKEYFFDEFFRLHADSFPKEEIVQYWLEQCTPVHNFDELGGRAFLEERGSETDDGEDIEGLEATELERRLHLQDPRSLLFGGWAHRLGDADETAQREESLEAPFLGGWAHDADEEAHTDESPALRPEQALFLGGWALPANSLDSPALGPSALSLPSPMLGPIPADFDELGTPRECMVEGCSFFAGAAGLCSCCYRQEFGCTPPPLPPRNAEPQEDRDSVPHSEDDAGVGTGPAAKKKKKKKKKKNKEGQGSNDVVDVAPVEARSAAPELVTELLPPPSPINKKEPRRIQIRRWLEQAGLLDGDAEPRCALVYDGNMCSHRGPSEHPEQPERLKEIWKQLGEAGLVDACKKVRSRQATKKELLYVHSEEHVAQVLKFQSKDHSDSEVAGAKGIAFPFGVDTYMCDQSSRVALIAVGSLLNLIDHAMKKDSELHCGMAVIRPPGHHASRDKVAGFCLFNNVAIAARHLQKVHNLRRVMIVDWDVHHGNGTDSIFANSQDVLFFSMHRFDSAGKFFPGTGKLEDIGKGPANGFSINVPLHKGYNDSDAKHVMRHVLRPLVERFNPEAILVSAGFDAVNGDPLGGCFMTPQGFGWMTRYLYHLARKHCEGHLFLALEGGYNCDMIARCAVECVNTLVLESTGVPACEIPPLPPAMLSPAASPCASPAWTASSAPKSPQMLRQSSPMSPKSSPKHRSGGFPTDKTVSVVRKLTELHSKLRFKLPISPEIGTPFDPCDEDLFTQIAE